MNLDMKWLAWEITSRCNLSCIHCRSSSTMQKEENELTTKEAFKLLDDLAEFAKPTIVLSGGEPLLRKDVYEIARYGAEKGIRMTLATNGTLVNDEIAKKIKDSGIKSCSLSLDGATPEVHDNFRKQKGAFKSVMRCIEIFKKHNIPFLINSSFTKRNQKDIAETLRMATELGAMAWFMFVIIPTGRGAGVTEEFIDKDTYVEILKWHYEREKEGKIRMRPVCAPFYFRLKKEWGDKENIKDKSSPLGFISDRGCIGAVGGVFVSKEGMVTPCSYFPFEVGHVRKNSIREIWENSPRLNELRDFDNYQGDCHYCEYRVVCGGCRALAYFFKGNHLEKDPYCDYKPKRI